MKQGLRYFQMDTDRYQDRKVKKLKKAFGCAGLAIYDYVLCEVYRVDGCGLVWDDDTAFDVAEYLGVKESLVQEVVKYCGVVGLFDATLLSGGIITSAAIQRRYLEMCKRSRRTDYNIPEEWAIITEEMPKTPTEMEKMPSSSQKLPSDVGVTLQKSQKLPTKIKENKIKENISLSISPSFEVEKRGDFDREREERNSFFEIFFYKNFTDPAKEVDRFVAHYSACGWCRSNGQHIVDKNAVAQLWEQADKNTSPRFPASFLEAIKSAHQAIWDADQDATGFLEGIIGVESNDELVRIFCTRRTAQLLDGCGLEALQQSPFFAGKKIKYAVKREK